MFRGKCILLLYILQFHHRDPGLVGLLTTLKLERKQIYYGIIADGNHTHETVLRIAYKSNPTGLFLWVIRRDSLPRHIIVLRLQSMPTCPYGVTFRGRLEGVHKKEGHPCGSDQLPLDELYGLTYSLSDQV